MLKFFKEFLKGSKNSKAKISIWDIIPNNVYQMVLVKDKTWRLDAVDAEGINISLGEINEKFFNETVIFPKHSLEYKPKFKVSDKNPDLKNFIIRSKGSLRHKMSIWDIVPKEVYAMTKANNKNDGEWNLDYYNERRETRFLGTIRRNLYEDNVQFPVGSFSQKPKK